MKLRVYIAVFSFLILTLVLTFSYAFLERTVSTAFDELSDAEKDQVQRVADSFILLQRKKLENIQGLLSRSSDLASSYILSQETQDRRFLESRLEVLRAQSGLDFLTIVKPNAKPSGFTFSKVKGRLSLVMTAPLFFYEEQIGSIQAGYSLEGVLLSDLREITNQNSLNLFLGEDGRLSLSGLQSSIKVLDRKKAILPKVLASLLGAFVVLYLLIFMFFDLGFMANFRDILSKLRTSAMRLREGSLSDYVGSQNFVSELNDLDESALELHRALVTYRDQIDSTLREQQEVEKKVALADLASQVVHDIRSPVASLHIVVNSLSRLSITEKDLLLRSLKRISEISDDLLKRRKQLKDEVQLRLEPVLLAQVFDSLASETRIRLSGSGISFKSPSNRSDLMKFVMAEEAGLKRVLSNILGNAREALISSGGQGEINFDLIVENSRVKLIIEDDGPGIPESIKERVFEKDFTFNKDGGSGLGLYYAYHNLKRWNATLEILSREPQGTRVEIVMEEVDRPSWLMPKVPDLRGRNLAIVDDDSVFRGAWEQIVGSKASLVCFDSAAAFENHMLQADKRAFDLYFIDHDLGFDSIKGTGLIDKYKLSGRAVLVTGREIDGNLVKETSRLGVSILPKRLCAEVLEGGLA